MLTVVIDTNVFVSTVISSRSAPAQLLSYWQSGLFDLISCQKAIDELDEVLRRPHLVEKYSIDNYKRETFLGIIRERVIFVEGDSLKNIVRDDPKDDMFVACAVEGRAKYIISGDKHLRTMRRYGFIRIIEPAYFLNILDRCNQMR